MTRTFPRAVSDFEKRQIMITKSGDIYRKLITNSWQEIFERF